ncbi:hypothetical protein [Lacimicrobium sp. SS2-24]|uniref:hypothetical protein n=1 Tax=Lacimicrobium sp. SS2-24 TaxID=2005569 RepID=UPI000B4A8DB3|nr:hypothetical protein [Lacimicrobium sp. SS2-24]
MSLASSDNFVAAGHLFALISRPLLLFYIKVFACQSGFKRPYGKFIHFNGGALKKEQQNKA